jgi:hypothetical protein
MRCTPPSLVLFLVMRVGVPEDLQWFDMIPPFGRVSKYNGTGNNSGGKRSLFYSGDPNVGLLERQVTRLFIFKNLDSDEAIKCTHAAKKKKKKKRCKGGIQGPREE